MAALRLRIGEHPFIGGFLGFFLFGGAAIYFGTNALFALAMALLGFLLAVAVVLTLAGKRGHHEELNATISDGRGNLESLRMKALNGRRLVDR